MNTETPHLPIVNLLTEYQILLTIIAKPALNLLQ